MPDSKITVDDFAHIRRLLGAQAEDDIAWAQSTSLPATPEEFALETAFVICNSGMKNTVARGIFERVRAALHDGRPVLEAFKHPGKAGAIQWIWCERGRLHAELKHRAAQGSEQLLWFCESLPWIGGITKYHLAKNFGANVAKPDVHLQRLADREGCTAQQLCERLAESTGLSAAVIDVVLWRACANGVINSQTGAIRAQKEPQ